MVISLLKSLLPNRPLPLPILGGPFRGAVIQLNPRHSLRKVFGVYEHELSNWLEKVLTEVNLVLDVGANDGYFTFGCAKFFRRLKKQGKIIAFEPIDFHFLQLQSSLKILDQKLVSFYLYHKKVGDTNSYDTITLDSIVCQHALDKPNNRALIKIDVEGAELEVIAGASRWLNSKNYFLIEVHQEEFLSQLKQLFQEKGIILEQVNQKPLPVLGREQRSPSNWWLVSALT